MKNKEKYKKIGLAFVSFFLMVSIAGYINYRYNPEREKNLGQTVYVSTNNDEVKIYEEEKEPVKDIEQEEETVISKYREDRDNMYMELANSYSSVINNNNTSQETLTEYQQKLSGLVQEKNKILISENIIRMKGAKDVAIVITDSSRANVIVEADNLDDSFIAQIVDVIVENFAISPENITIESVNV
jgi:hypothetical protein